MAVGTKASDEMITDINVTPLVDVLLVLLIMVMAAAPAMFGQTRVELPVAKSTEAANHVTLRFYLNRDHKVSLENHPMSYDEAMVACQQALQRDPHADSLIVADNSLSHGEVIEFIDRLKEAGLHRVGLGSRKQ